MNNPINTQKGIAVPIERVVKLLDNLTAKDTAIVRQETLEHYHVNLKEFYPEKINGNYATSQLAFEVQEDKLYDLSIGSYALIGLTYSEERKNYREMQRYLVLYECDLIFKLFTELRALNAKIVFKNNGIWAYKNDSELYSDREMAKRMVVKLEAEKQSLTASRAETILALQAASIESNVTSEAMEILFQELELPSF